MSPRQTVAQEQIVIAQALQQAVSCHQRGLLAEARQLYGGILKLQKHHFDALHLLGVLEQQGGNSAEALKLITAALRRNDRSPAALSNKGAVLTSLGQHAEALASLDRALALEPAFVDALANRANILIALGRYQEALADCDRATALEPGRGDVSTHSGNALVGLGRYADARARFESVLRAQPDSPEALLGYGKALAKLGGQQRAINAFDRAIAIRPNYIDALNAKGCALLELRSFEDALIVYDMALTIDPEYTEALNNKGIVLQELGRYAEALVVYDTALELNPRFVPALVNYGKLLYELARYEEAIAAFQRAIDVRPDYADAHFNEALARICLGDFLQGWRKYEWRWKKANFSDAGRTFSEPLWTGEFSVEGKTILIHAEQGLGDTLHFVRYVPLLAQHGASVVLEVQEPLRILLASSLEGISCVKGSGEPLPEADYRCPLLSLPNAFRTEAQTIPASVPYLRAPPEHVRKWETRFKDVTALRVGLTWAGKATQAHDHNRSIPLRHVLQLCGVSGVQFYSLQKDLRPGDAELLRDRPNVIDLGEELTDFADTAAVIELLDLVISVDTAVPHLAGALGQAVWVLLSAAGDWHWIMQGRQDSPWYPTAQLFRQPAAGDWRSVLLSLQVALEQKSALHRSMRR